MSVHDEAIRAHRRCPGCISEDKGVLRREGCALEIPRDRALGIDCDTCQVFSDPRSKKPDFIVLYESGQSNPTPVPPRWIIVEMERHIRDAREVLQQLSAGANIVRTDDRFQFSGSPELIQGLVLHSGKCHVAQAEVIRQRGARMGGVRITVQLRNADGPGVRLVQVGQSLAVRPR